MEDPKYLNCLVNIINSLKNLNQQIYQDYNQDKANMHVKAVMTCKYMLLNIFKLMKMKNMFKILKN